jgi:hypothetical protein
MVFIAILILTTLSIAGSAAFFSVYGLAQIFTGSFWPVVVMASSLEAGKLVAASYAYRYWDKITFALKAYLISAILVLMLITSVGIFGFLSAAYQKDILPLAEMETKITLLDQKITDLERIRSEDQVQLQRLQDDKAREIAALPANFATKKTEVATRYQERIARVEENIAAYTLQIRATNEEKQDLKLATLQQELKTGPIIFIAEALGREVNDATKWLILIIIFAFDPLAVALTVGVNIAIIERQRSKESQYDDFEDFDEPNPSITTLDQIFSEGYNDTIPSDKLRQALDELSSRELSPIEQAQKSFIEEMLRRKSVTERIRNPSKES